MPRELKQKRKWKCEKKTEFRLLHACLCCFDSSTTAAAGISRAPAAYKQQPKYICCAYCVCIAAFQEWKRKKYKPTTRQRHNSRGSILLFVWRVHEKDKGTKTERSEKSGRTNWKQCVYLHFICSPRHSTERKRERERDAPVTCTT